MGTDAPSRQPEQERAATSIGDSGRANQKMVAELAPPAGDKAAQGPLKQAADRPVGAQELADGFDKALQTKDFTAVDRGMSASIKDAYKTGGMDAVQRLQQTVNDKVKAEGAGPLFLKDGNAIVVHNAREMTPAERDLAKQMTPVEQARSGIIQVKDQEPTMRDIQGTKPYKVELAEAPKTPERKLEAGDKPVAGAGKLSELAASPYLTALALKAGGMDKTQWTPQNPEQKQLVDSLPQVTRELGDIPKGILDAKSSVGDVKPVNQFLKDKGFDIQLRPIGQNEVAMAATLDVNVDWKGKATTMDVGGKTVPAVDLDGNRSYNINGRTVVELGKKDGVTLYAMKADNPGAGYQVTEMARNFTPNANSEADVYKGVRVGMIDLNKSQEMSGLVGMRGQNGERISQALSQVKVQLDENGARVQEAQALATTRSISIPKRAVLDGNIILWGKADNGSQPLFSVYVDSENYKRPPARK